ncbi:MAG: T9SS type A sorting domain-containing protein [Saprospiraceae bacterium]|nr:T9SS type A sorting domain-containing protein [Saprospiraceae bacterium]
MGDPLAGFFNENVGKIKLKAWRGPNYIFDPGTEEAGVDWILAESWMPYQRPTFVTPPFAGYISGHSTYSRAAAEALTLITGDAYFPGGMGVFEAPADEFLVFEDGPSQHITLQWATYRDASDQCSLSRIWGGIHPPCDDIPGRLIGAEVGTDAFELARAYFYRDDDNDGYFSYEDCDDGDPGIHPGTEEICDGRDNDCNGLVDDGLPIYTYYRDADGDGYGNAAIQLDTCLATMPMGYVAIDGDCDDGEPGINPAAEEVCDGIDNDCDGGIDDGLTVFTYYRDADGDGFGNAATALDTCLTVPPTGFVANAGDCNDGAPGINPAAEEICDGIDNDCNGGVDDGLTVFTYYRDADGDGFGNAATTLDTCLAMPPLGFVANDGDCNDEAPAINPAAEEICDGIDNDCNGGVDDGLALIAYYRDADVDGFGNAADSVQTCYTTPPAGYVANDADCDDERGSIRPDATDIPDNGIDEDCSGSDLYLLTKIYPNPVRDELTIHFAHEGTKDLLIYNAAGQSIGARQLQFIANVATVSLADLAPGVYILRISGRDGDAVVHKIVKL